MRHDDEVCVWTCKHCGAENVEYPPFPATALCSECDREEPNYCTHGPEVKEPAEHGA